MPKQTHNDLIRDILSDLAVELEDEFKRNFERKAFFDKKWKPSPHGLIDSGDLRESITGSDTRLRQVIYRWQLLGCIEVIEEGRAANGSRQSVRFRKKR